ncbi:hypothetical protein AMJ40_02770 [candidate division TA06 bacterium DG_26]|uniref:Uncharacterized protein n=1 Tax=candidate division TA06 bacterium DG_26 TaxID=1703771 RepID=A0A0S7WK02_UNCT6|nr:MAG: hypothetical protein AMJ40_02770 [candidate division TA06 bacterium DG_26]
MIPLLLFIIGISQKQIESQPIILDGANDVYASEYLFISTQFGIYSFDRYSEKWTKFTQAAGLPRNQAHIIALDEGILWVATRGGLASADVRINDWQTYDSEEVAEGIAFDEQYVWIGGYFGLKRFHKYTELWEQMSDMKVNDLFSEQGYVWCATDSGVLRYHQDFERIERVPGAPDDPYVRIIATPHRVWFISHDYFVAYNRDVESWSTYESLEIDDYANVGDSLFVVSERQVYLYEPTADHWALFRDVEDLDAVNGIFADGQELLFAMDDGLLMYNSNERTRRRFNRSSGLEVDSLIDVYQDAKYVFAVNRRNIEFLNRETGIWRVERLTPPEGRKVSLVYLDEAGAHARLIPDTDVKLIGRAYYSESRTLSNSVHTRTDYENINLKLLAEHTSGRLTSFYYDDTDKTYPMYGFAYRGVNEDPLHRAQGGYLESEYFEFDLIPQFSTFGANAKLRRGTSGIDLQGGELKSRCRSDFFTGRSTEKRTTLFDTQYSKNTFYLVYSEPRMMRKGIDTVFVDDCHPSSNRIDTRTEFSIAGITGDFDPLIHGIDYSVDWTRGIIHFAAARGDSDVIVLWLDGSEIIIQSDAVREHALTNIYCVGPRILPNSFSLAVSDSLGNTHPLSEFGLDMDGDNQVDPEFLDYNLGQLRFPDRRPFPDEVYNEGIHVYTLDIRFVSETVFYYLSCKPVARGSEKVHVDGELMQRGTHYILDYTSGILLFLTEHMVSDFSEVEVIYSSLEREREDQFYAVQPSFGIGNDLTIAPGFSSFEDERILHLSTRYQRSSDADQRMRFTSQLALNNENEWAQGHSLVANYGMFSVNTEYRGYTGDFEAFGANERKYGRLEHRGLISASVEPHSHVRFDAGLEREYLADSLSNRNITQHAYGRLNYLNPRLPNGHLLVGRDVLPDYRKNRVTLNVNYDLEVFRSKVKLNSVLRNIRAQTDQEERSKIDEYIVDANFSFPVLIHGNIYFRYNEFKTNDVMEKCEEEIKGTLNADLIPGIYYVGTYDLAATTFFVGQSEDLVLNHYLYNNLSIAPGRWQRELSIINISLGLGRSFAEYVNDLPAEYRRPRLIFKPLEDVPVSSIDNLHSYYGLIQLTPYSNFSVWLKRTLNESGLAYYGMPDLRPTLRDELRIEYEPRILGIFTISLDQRRSESYPIQTSRNTYFEWNMPWSTSLRTKLTTNYWMSRDDYGRLYTTTSELKTNAELLFRLHSDSFVRFNVGGARKREDVNGIIHTLTPGVGLNLNLFRFLYIQFDGESTFSQDDVPIYMLSTKLTGQL